MTDTSLPQLDLFLETAITIFEYVTKTSHFSYGKPHMMAFCVFFSQILKKKVYKNTTRIPLPVRWPIHAVQSVHCCFLHCHAIMTSLPTCFFASARCSLIINSNYLGPCPSVSADIFTSCPYFEGDLSTESGPCWPHFRRHQLHTTLVQTLKQLLPAV